MIPWPLLLRRFCYGLKHICRSLNVMLHPVCPPNFAARRRIAFRGARAGALKKGWCWGGCADELFSRIQSQSTVLKCFPYLYYFPTLPPRKARIPQPNATLCLAWPTCFAVRRRIAFRRARVESWEESCAWIVWGSFGFGAGAFYIFTSFLAS
ncbi:hypothetical protein IW261DRAFT_1000872 [Armillaria novae-zelandiae]|uniref:Uncharacterized protein n=1 Tax=Armillaria novae-zelandiae TaxID=153914 RepID=A0AA39NRS3_9AGAR|nr:hypothetical protein IW261DRAFT_1000872 [Armillaria novae-zelandiae]